MRCQLVWSVPWRRVIQISRSEQCQATANALATTNVVHVRMYRSDTSVLPLQPTCYLFLIAKFLVFVIGIQCSNSAMQSVVAGRDESQKKQQK